MAKTNENLGPVAKSLEIVGDRWTILILQELLRGQHRFAELMEAVQGISSNILSDRLKLLERFGIVERVFYSDHPPRAKYHLTKRGHELGIVTGALAVWGAKYLSDSGALVHNECGSPMHVVYYCSQCNAQVAGAEVRLIERAEAL